MPMPLSLKLPTKMMRTYPFDATVRPELIALAAPPVEAQASSPAELNDLIHALVNSQAHSTASRELQTPAERRQQAELDRMLQHPEDKVHANANDRPRFSFARPDRAVDQRSTSLDVQGIPRFFSQLGSRSAARLPIIRQPICPA